MSKVSKQYLFYLSIVFCNSFVDLGHKVIIQNTFFQTSTPKTYTVMSAIVNAMILLPYIFLFSPSGFISDKFSKTTVLRITAFAAIPIAIFITFSYYMGWFWVAFVGTFFLAIQSAINSPAKYGYIKELFGEEKIASANAYVQAVVIISILMGTFVFSILFQHLLSSHGVMHGMIISKTRVMSIIAPLGSLLIISSLLEFIFTFFIPMKQSSDPSSTFSLRKYFQLKYVSQNVNSIYKNKVIYTCIIALAIFWGVGQVLLANYGAYLKEYVPDASVTFAQGSLAIAGLGVLVGALYAGRISRGFIETGVIPIAAAGITTSLFLIPMLTNKMFIILLFFFYGVFGGMLIVPLNALIQFNAPHKRLGMILAGNNFTQNIFMFLFLVATVVLTLLKVDSILLLRLLFIIGVLTTFYALVRLPQSLSRYIVYVFISKAYRIEAFGMKNIPASGPVLLLGNHTSFLDWAVLQVTCPRPIRFVMDRKYYDKWYLKWILGFFDAIPISNTNSRSSLKKITKALQAGELVALFPEGFISRNGQLGKFHRGYEIAVRETQTALVPFFIRGLWGSIASLSTDEYRRMSKHAITRGVTICYGEPLPTKTIASELKVHVFNLGLKTWSCYAKRLSSIHEEWLRRAKKMKNKIVAAESSGRKLSGYKMIAFFIAMRKILKREITLSGEKVGILLPPTIGGAVTNLVLLSLRKKVVNLNYTSSQEALRHTLQASNIKTIISSRKFISRLKKRGFYLEKLLNPFQVLYLEDHKERFEAWSMIKPFIIARFLPLFFLKMLFLKYDDPENTAIIYFSSGSEGVPKGVELSHQNILVNAKQVSCLLNLQHNDSVLGSLPLFHAFGLTVTTLMPLVEGVPVVFHPDPTDAKGVGQTIARFNVTLLCGTSTFLGIYTRHPKVHPLMFKSLRLVVSGAEKLSSLVAEQFFRKFGVQILEGYGATETSPVVSINLPDILIPEFWYIQQGGKLGTVGMPVPGTMIKIVDPDTRQELSPGKAGMIIVAGPQVMKSYLDDPKKTSEVLYEDQDGVRWYVTGDQGYLDDDGYITITDRYARFAKIGGEMVSLTAVESTTQPHLPKGTESVAVSLPDEKKGEKIILLLSNTPDIHRDYRGDLQKAEIHSLMLPQKVYVIDTIPKLGSGKTDFIQAKKTAGRLEGETESVGREIES